MVVTDNKREAVLLLQVKDEKPSLGGRKYKPVCPVNLEQQRRMVTEQVYITTVLQVMNLRPMNVIQTVISHNTHLVTYVSPV